MVVEPRQLGWSKDWEFDIRQQVLDGINFIAVLPFQQEIKELALFVDAAL